MRRSTEVQSILAAIAILSISACSLTGCASTELGGANVVRFGDNNGGQDGKAGVASQAELQSELLRFTSLFNERITESTEKLIQGESPELRRSALIRLLRYASSALDISTGPSPEVNLLDMMSFVRLNRVLLEEYWVPEFYGPKAEVLLAAFRNSEQDLIGIADKVLTKAQQRQLDNLVQSWRRDNPNQVYVEWVRLFNFSEKAGRLEIERSEKASGLLASVKGAVSSVDQALLLGNRALFLGQRMPFLVRLQARIGSQEILSDSIHQLAGTGDTLDQVGPIVQNLSMVTAHLDKLIERTRPLMADFRKYFPHDTTSTLTQKISIGERITSNLLNLLTELNRQPVEGGESKAHAIRAQLDGLIWSATKALLLLGMAWAVFWWGGYYLVKRPHLRSIRKIDQRERGPGRKKLPPSSGAAA